LRGRKSEATKRRGKLIASGHLEPERKNSVKAASGRLGAIATHGPRFLAKLPTVRGLAVEQVRAAVIDVARQDAPACAKFLADLALGRGAYKEAPLRERRQAANDVLQLAGVSLVPRQADHEKLPISEMSLEQLQADIDELERKIAQGEIRAKLHGKADDAEDATIIESGAAFAESSPAVVTATSRRS
jgi:hypothetical protein